MVTIVATFSARYSSMQKKQILYRAYALYYIKQKMNVARSLLDDIKTKQLQWYGHVQRMEDFSAYKVLVYEFFPL